MIPHSTLHQAGLQGLLPLKPLLTLAYREAGELSMKAGSKSGLILLKPQMTLAHEKKQKGKGTWN